jgi:hypothetical protein
MIFDEMNRMNGVWLKIHHFVVYCPSFLSLVSVPRQQGISTPTTQTNAF